MGPVLDFDRLPLCTTLRCVFNTVRSLIRYHWLGPGQTHGTTLFPKRKANCWWPISNLPSLFLRKNVSWKSLIVCPLWGDFYRPRSFQISNPMGEMYSSWNSNPIWCVICLNPTNRSFRALVLSSHYLQVLSLVVRKVREMLVAFLLMKSVIPGACALRISREIVRGNTISELNVLVTGIFVRLFRP